MVCEESPVSLLGKDTLRTGPGLLDVVRYVRCRLEILGVDSRRYWREADAHLRLMPVQQSTEPELSANLSMLHLAFFSVLLAAVGDSMALGTVHQFSS